MEIPRAIEAPPAEVDRRIARRLEFLRAERGFTLDTLAERTGLSRATLSRLERGELSPTTSMLGKVCALYGWTLTRLLAAVETDGPNVVGAAAQEEWTDPGTGCLRRVVSPPGPGLRAELTQVRMPPEAVVEFEKPPQPGLEHHLWMLQGTLSLDIEGSVFRLTKGDCLRYVLNGRTQFVNTTRTEVVYLVATVRP